MKKINLPDGRFVEVPDDISRDQAINLQNLLASEYPDTYSPYQEEVEPTLGGDLAEIAKGIPRGLASTFISAGEGINNLFDSGNDNELGNYLTGLQEALNESSLGAADGYEDRFSSKLGQGLGSFASFLIPGTAIAKGMGLAGKAAAAQSTLAKAGATNTQIAKAVSRIYRPQTLTTLGLAMPVGIAEQGRNIRQAEALGEDVSAGQELFSEILGAGIGASELIAPTRLLRSIDKATSKQLGVPKRLMDALTTGGVEGLQEMSAGILQDVVSRGVYTDKLPIGDSALDDATVGGATGFIADLLMRGLVGRKPFGNEYQQEQEGEGRKIEKDALDKRKNAINSVDIDATPVIDETVLPNPLEETLDAQEEQTVVEQTIEELPILENIILETQQVIDPTTQEVDTIFNLVGNETGQIFGEFNSSEEAFEAQAKIENQIIGDFTGTLADQTAEINGFKGNGQIESLGRKLYNPLYNKIDARTIAIFDSRSSLARQEQVDNQREIDETKATLERQIVNDLTGEGTINPETTKKLEALESRAKQLSIADYKQSGRKLVKQKNNLAPLDQTLLRAEKLGIGSKNFYEIAEAKKLLLPEDFNTLMSEKANLIYKVDERSGIIKTVQRDADRIDVSRDAFLETLNSKRLETSLNSPEFQYLAETFVGEANFNKMNRGQKELLITRLKGLPMMSNLATGSFDNLTKLPNMRPRPYTPQQINDFYNATKDQAITDKTITDITKLQGLNLTKKERDQFKKDLVDSGRAIKVGNKVKGNPNYELEVARKITPFQETNEEYLARLNKSGLQQEEIIAKTEDKIKEDSNPLLLPAPITDKSYDNLIDVAMQRLKQYGLTDVGVKFGNALKNSRTLGTDAQGEAVFISRESEKTAEGEYDPATNDILFIMERISKDSEGNQLSPEQIKDKLLENIDHETIHALVQLDVLTELEYNTLLDFAVEKLGKKKVVVNGESMTELQRINKIYNSDQAMNPAILQEEYVAELFRLYRDNPKDFKAKPKTIIEKILNFFSEVVQSITGSVFRSPLNILEDISTGAIGRRTRDVQRSLRVTRKMAGQVLSAEDIINQTNTDEEIDSTNKFNDDVFGNPVFIKRAFNAKDILDDSDINRDLLSVFRRTNGNVTAKDFQDIFKKYSPRGKVPPFKDLKELQADVQDALRLGVDANWYQRWSLQAPLLVGSVNMNEFSSVFGITSEQAKPEKNFQDTLNTMIIAREIDPDTSRKKFIAKLSELDVGKKNKNRLERIANLYRDGILSKKGTGQKTTSYALEIAESSQGRFTPYTVVDIHMLRKLGLIPKGSNLKSAPDVSYQIATGMMSLLGSMNYNRNGEIVQIPDNSKIQALLWGHQRYNGPTKITNEGSYDAAKAESKSQVSKIQEMQKTGKWNMESSFKGKFLFSPRYVNNNGKFDTDTRNNFTNRILQVGPRIVNELLIGRERNYLPANVSLTQAQRNAFYFKALNAISTGNQITFLRKMGVPHQITISAGSWEGAWNPNLVLNLPMTSLPTQRAIAKILNDALLQDGTPIIKPTSGGIKKTAIYLEKADGTNFSELDLNNVLETVQVADPTGQTNFTVTPHKGVNGLSFIHPKSFKGDLTQEDLNLFMQFFNDNFSGQGYTISNYGQESEYIDYNSGDTRGAIEEIQNQDVALEPSSIQRTVIRDLYLPFQREYERFAEEVGFTPLKDKAYEQPNSAIQPLNGAVDKAEIDAVLEIDRQNRATKPTAIPRFNNNASGFAKKVALDFEAGNLDYLDIPTFKRSDATMPDQHKDLAEATGAVNQAEKSFFDSIKENAEWTESAKDFLARMRSEFVFGYAVVEREIKKGAANSAEIAEEEARARSGAIQALIMSDKSKGVFGAMLNHGIPTLDKGIVSVIKNERLALINIFGPLMNEMAETGVDLENIFKMYAIATRGVRLNDVGIEVPMTPEQIQEGLALGSQYSIVKETFNLYQEQNSYIIDLLVSSGLASREPNYTEIRKRLLEFNIDSAKTANKEELIRLATERNEVLETADKIELRPTAQIWKDNADYYPFYRQIADESIVGPNVGGGSLGGNPLNHKLRGSTAALDASPLSVIFKNQLAIVNAAMKNDAHRKLVRNYVKSDSTLNSGQQRAKEVSAKEAQGSDIIPIYIDGAKRFFKVEDPQMLYGLTTMGIANENVITKFLTLPATVLRETVTRDPGFVLVNMFRDTLSAFVTSGADFTPVLGTVKGFSEDMENLERFGVLGGYDYSADALSVEKYVKQQFRLSGKDKSGAMNPTTMALKLWDFLGKQTYKSDGATRQAVYKAVYEKTGDEVEAAFQAAEIINFSRRGNNPIAKIIFSAIPFLNARVQGLDVLYRSMTGKYSANNPGASISSNKEMQNQIIRGFLTRGGLLTLATALYYALASDDEQYKERRREERDDHWMIFREKGQEPLKLPVPFEVGLLFKTIPERIMDTIAGDSTLGDLKTTVGRGVSNTLLVNPLNFQTIKPVVEAYVNNKSGFTGSPIVPQYMEQSYKDSEQYRESTNELAKVLGQAFDTSPIKLEYVMNGYGGTLGGYVLSLIDATLRQFTGRDYITPRIDQLPVIKRFLASPIGGGLQQQFYELRAESNKVVSTINALRERNKEDVLIAYMKNNDGLIRTRQQVLALDRYMTYWRDRRDRTLRDESISADVKKGLLQELEAERNLRLMYIPELREQAYASQ